MTDLLPSDVETLTAETPHVACCVYDAFFCGKPFHPELVAGVADDEDDEDDCCRTCVLRARDMLCPPANPNHAHCGINPLRVCQDAI